MHASCRNPAISKLWHRGLALTTTQNSSIADILLHLDFASGHNRESALLMIIEMIMNKFTSAGAMALKLVTAYKFERRW